jgi:ketosteroid isomerase-like protein
MDLEALTDTLFGSAARQDWDGFASMFAPDARMKQNFGAETDVAAALTNLRGLMAIGLTIAYENVRRVVTSDVVVEQHDVRMRRTDGVEVVADVCVLLRFDGSGLITRLDEYVDTAVFAPLLARN